jgi:hypothetical protein
MVSTRPGSWYQLAPGHGINVAPMTSTFRVMPVSTRPRSWYQLAPGHGINVAPMTSTFRVMPVLTRPRSWFQLAPSHLINSPGSWYWYQCAPTGTHGINSPRLIVSTHSESWYQRFNSPRLMVSTRPGSWYQLGPMTSTSRDAGINSPRPWYQLAPSLSINSPRANCLDFRNYLSTPPNAAARF